MKKKLTNSETTLIYRYEATLEEVVNDCLDWINNFGVESTRIIVSRLVWPVSRKEEAIATIRKNGYPSFKIVRDEMYGVYTTMEVINVSTMLPDQREVQDSSYVVYVTEKINHVIGENRNNDNARSMNSGNPT